MEALTCVHGLMRYVKNSETIVLLSNGTIASRSRSLKTDDVSIDLRSITKTMASAVVVSLGGIHFDYETKHPVDDLRKIVRYTGKGKLLSLTYTPSTSAKEAAPYLFDPSKSLSLPSEVIKKGSYTSCLVFTQSNVVESKVDGGVTSGKERAQSKKLGGFPKDLKIRLGSVTVDTCTPAAAMLFTHSGFSSVIPYALLTPYDTLISKKLFIHHLIRGRGKEVEEEINSLRDECLEFLTLLKR